MLQIKKKCNQKITSSEIYLNFQSTRIGTLANITIIELFQVIVKKGRTHNWPCLSAEKTRNHTLLLVKHLTVINKRTGHIIAGIIIINSPAIGSRAAV